MEPSYEKLLATLSAAEVRFVIVGGIAVTLQGYARFTEDIDLLIARDQRNVRQMLACLSSFGEGYASQLVWEDFEDEEGAIRIIEESELCQMYLFTRLGGRTYEDVLEDASVIKIAGYEVHYASKASLVRWKGQSVREKDRMDANALRLLEKDQQAFD